MLQNSGQSNSKDPLICPLSKSVILISLLRILLLLIHQTTHKYPKSYYYCLKLRYWSTGILRITDGPHRVCSEKSKTSIAGAYCPYFFASFPSTTIFPSFISVLDESYSTWDASFPDRLCPLNFRRKITKSCSTWKFHLFD